MQQTIDAAHVNKRAVIGQILDRAGQHGALAEVLERRIATGRLLLFEDFLAADNHIAALLVQLDDANFDLLAEVAIQIAHRANLKLRTGQEGLHADIDSQTTLDAADDGANDGRLLCRCLFDRIPYAQALGLLVADQVATFGLLALDDHVDHIAGVEAHGTRVILHLLEGHYALRLQAHVDNQILFRLLDHRAGDDLVAISLDSGLFGCLFALKGFKGGRKVNRVKMVGFGLRFRGGGSSSRRRGGIGVRSGGNSRLWGGRGFGRRLLSLRRRCERWGFQFGVQGCALGFGIKDVCHYGQLRDPGFHTAAPNFVGYVCAALLLWLRPVSAISRQIRVPPVLLKPAQFEV